MKKQKSILILLLTAALLFCGCSNPQGNSQGTSEQTSQVISSAVESEVSDTSDNSQQPFSSKEEESSEQPVSSQAEQSVTSVIVQESSEPEPVDRAVFYDFEKKYFVNKLNEDQLRCFAQLYEAAASFTDEVRFNHTISDSELSDLMFLLNYDCPELIQLNGDYYPDYPTGHMDIVSGVRLTFCMDKRVYSRAMSELKDYFSRLRTELNGMNDFEKEREVYNRIAENDEYSETEKYSGSIYGALIKGVARCEGISKAFTMCMRELDIPCLGVTGQQSWDELSLYSEHSWNIVKLYDDWYHVDITVDNLNQGDGQPAVLNYGFFNVDSKTVFEDRALNHAFAALGVPECDKMDLNYHVLNDLYCRSGEDWRTFIDERLQRSFDGWSIHELSIRFEDRTDYDKAASEIEDVVRDFLNANSEVVLTYNTYFNSLSHTLVIDAWKDTDEG